MCNVCNASVYTHGGCGYIARNTCGCGFWNALWNTATQSICRDCCGNIHVRQTGCGCCNYHTNVQNVNACGYGANVGNAGCTVNGTATATTCGRCQSPLAGLNGDAYYARLYGLTNTANTTNTNAINTGSYSCGWGCGSCFGCCRNRCPYNFTVVDATDLT